MRPFHLALPVYDLDKARAFYVDLLGFEEGRSDTDWIDINFFGHQVVFHKTGGAAIDSTKNSVDGHPIPVPHFGVILEWKKWETFVEKLHTVSIDFAIAPYVRFKGKKGEQATCFFYDPNGVALEFKAFRNNSMIFES